MLGYWVSKLDKASPVTLTVDFDEPAPVLEVGLDFEFVPAACKPQAERASGQTCMPQTLMSSRQQRFH